MRSYAARSALIVAVAGLTVAATTLLLAAVGLRPESEPLAWALIASFAATAVLVIPLQQSLRARYPPRELQQLLRSLTPTWLRLVAGTLFISGFALGLLLDQKPDPLPTSPRLLLISAVSLAWYGLVIVTAYPMLLLDAGTDNVDA